ncbi:hypothetical protein SAMN04487949_2660 [Halogranum gelatinilyticum]|uniref:Uncharacterized protein n=1 Tax=Halogranum gelatinilyticum TaxID=660521 RepID=A0A1G9W8M4_9EURY|nr:hypothetical protein [Halogranum gelatinilyticum]SDM80888.1 hypothetical protein SAMN04487949_2660 [Halogranum gelatinilyticum]
MALPTLPVPLDYVFLVGWPLLLVLAYRRYRRGELPRQQLYALGASAGLATGSSLVERSDSMQRPLDVVLEGTGLFVVFLGLLAAVGWWRRWRGDSDKGP